MSKSRICKKCGKEVTFYQVPKDNGKLRWYAFHVDDVIPAGSINVKDATESICSGHQIRRTKELQDNCKGSGAITPVETKETKEMPKLKETMPEIETKEEIEETIETKETKKIPEILPLPEIKPVLEINQMNKNKFAVVGAIYRTMKDIGYEERSLNILRNHMINEGKTLDNIVKITEPYITILENGSPFLK